MMPNFPVFTSSDPELDRTYRYRCELYGRHIKTTPAGHVISEFLPDVPWAGIYNTISCAAMHHFREGRWMAEPAPLAEYARFWCTEGNPRLYSFPIADSICRLGCVTGDFTPAEELYEQLTAIEQAWDDHRADNGMYTQLCDRDGMEYSISGDGIRPTINSYMYADKKALAWIAGRLGKTADAEKYEKEARTLCEQINRVLWNEKTGMFGVVSNAGEVQKVRELIGYIPWIFGVPDDGKDACFKNLLDPSCFLAKYGLRTADASHPAYMGHHDHCCLWNGPVWPFASAQTLTAVIEYLHAAENPTITADDFTGLLLTYAYSHRDADGTPWLDENMHPDTGIWLARELLSRLEDYALKDRGRHYNHSTFIDLVMTGVCGIIPAADDTLTIRPLGTSLGFFEVKDVHYHGHVLAVRWEKENGLKVTVDGTREYDSPAENPVITINL